MFSLGKRQPKDDQTVAGAAADAAVNQDLIVHNMPDAAKLSGAIVRGAATPAFLSAPSADTEPMADAGSSAAAPARSNTKAVGIAIMAVGLVFIGALVYLSYIFIIAPSAGTSPAPVVDNTAAPAAAPAPTADNLTPAAATTTDNNIASSSNSTASSSAAALASSTPDMSAATSTATSTPGAPAAGLSVAADSDHDGLNDNEEAVLGTSATSSDTDGDGYPDGVEVASGHNPVGPGLLAADPNLAVDTYQGDGFSYSILAPKAWPVQTLATDTTVIFTAPDESLIQISVSPNPAKASLLSWYAGSFPDATATPAIKDTATWEGLMGPDGQNFYLTDQKHGNIFVVTYYSNPNLAAGDGLTYPAIYQMMINSLTIR